jgi:hypothetical protein
VSPSLHHQTRIAKILEAHPEAKTDGWRAWARSFYEEHEPPPGADECGCDDEPCSCRASWEECRDEWLEPFSFRPDAWMVQGDGDEIVCWEVHVYGNPEQKIAQYIEAMWKLDELGPYRLRLIHVDAYGREAELDLFDEWGTRLRLSRGAAKR